MPYPLPLTRTEAYLAYKAGVIQQSDLKLSLAVPRNGIDAWLAYWTGLTDAYPVKKVGKNLFSGDFSQFDNTGGVGSLYAYFKLPDDGVYTLTLIAKNNVTGTSGTFFGFTTTGGDGTNPRNWVFYQGLTMTKGQTRSVTNVNGGVNQHYVSLYLPSSDTLQWFMDNFEIQLEKGSTATAYEPYPGGPLILQEEEAYIAYLCGVINEYPEKCLRRVGAYLRYLISARWGRPDHPLNREELYLSLIKTQFIPSGDPSSDIVIDGTAKAPFVDVKMYGDTFQQTYTGQNLYNVAQVSTGTYVTKDNDGWITITRDNTSGSSTVYTNVWTSNLALETSTQYKIFIEVKAVSGTGSLFITSTNSTEGQFSSWQEKTLASMAAGQTYTVAPTTKASFSGISKGLRTVLQQTVGQGGSVTFRLSVCASSTPTETFSYEPYTGGQPSPSPDYPQQIQTVTGRQVVKVEGKNLLSSVWESGTYNTVNGSKQVLANAYRTAEKIAVQSDTTYIVSRDSAGLAMNYYEYDANGNFLAYTLKSANQSITTGQTTKFITMSRSQTGGIEKMMLESGSTVTAYEPYSSNAYEINLAGKNLFDGIFELGNINPTTGANTSSTTTIRTKNYAVIKGGENYTISVVGGGIVAVGFYQSDGTFIGVGTTGASPNTFTAPANAGRVRFIIANNTNISTKAQCEAGSQATDYEPYFTPIELCKLGTYQDYIYKDGDSWKVHKDTGKYTFTGEETPIVNISSADTTRCQMVNLLPSSSQAKPQDSGSGLSNYFKYGIVWNSDKQGIWANSRTVVFRGGKTTIGTTLAEVQTWLTTNKPSLYYALETATDTTITDQALIDQLEALVAGGAENGTTYIKVNAIDPNLPGLLYVEAPKYE